MELWRPTAFPLTSFFDLRPHTLMEPMEEISREMEREFNRLERRLNSALRQELAPAVPAIDSSMSLGLQPAIVKEGDSRKYQLNIHMGRNFAPEDVKVSMKNGIVSINAKKEKTSEDGNSRFYQEVTRKFTLPSNVDVKQIKSALTPDGILKIEAPLPQEALPEPPRAKEIPVKVE